MKQVQKTIGGWVRRLAGNGRTETSLPPVRQPTELTAQTLRQVGGGTAESTQSPNKGW
jgi:hypothetical protein